MYSKNNTLFCVLYLFGLLSLVMPVVSVQAYEADTSLVLNQLQVRVDSERVSIVLDLMIKNNGPDSMSQYGYLKIEFPDTNTLVINIGEENCNFVTDPTTLLSAIGIFPSLQASDVFQCTVLLNVWPLVDTKYYDLDVSIEDSSSDPDLSNNHIQRRLWIGSDPIPIPSLSHVSLFLLMILVLATAGYVAQTAYGIGKDEIP